VIFQWDVATMRPLFDFLYGRKGAALITRALVLLRPRISLDT
jgi:hypothetical protein